MPKVAIYVRLSKEDRDKQLPTDDSGSVLNQHMMLLEFVRKNNWELYKAYIDEDFSGSDRERPEFNEMIKDAQAKKFDIILCKTQSRFARDIELVEKYLNYLFPIWGIRFLSLVDNADSDNKGNRKSRQINSMVDQWYLEDLSENVKATLASKRRQGLWVGAFAPYGYKKDPNNKNHLVVDEEAAEVVRYVFDLYLQGLGYNSIAKRLNRERIPNPATYKKQHNMPFQNCNGECSDIWHSYSIFNIIRNRIYIGDTVQGKTTNVSYKSKKKRQIPEKDWCVVAGTHEPIIDMDIWFDVQEMRKNRRRSDKTGKHGVFANKLFCMNCGSSMHSYITAQKKYYRCHTRCVAKDKCSDGACISHSVLEKNVLSEIRALYDKYFDVDIVTRNVVLRDNSKEKIEMLEKKLSDIEAGIAKLDKRVDAMYYDKLDGNISEDEYSRRKTECYKDKEQLQSLAPEYRAKLEKLQNRQDETDIIMQYIAKNKELKSLDRLTVDILIDYIVIGGTRDNRIIDIHWKF
ncbi:MAG: recombinase family protein [Ruminococcus sp.]|nr:recombinase family protein [Ruminococcus sp.]